MNSLSETGDLLFALVNLARHVGADPEIALRGTNAKFERRFAYIERALAAQGRSLESASLEEMDALWNEAKGSERTTSPTHSTVILRSRSLRRVSKDDGGVCGDAVSHSRLRDELGVEIRTSIASVPSSEP